MNIIAVADVPEVRDGDRLSDLLANHAQLIDRDVVVVASKVVAKAEGRIAAVDHDDEPKRRHLIESEAVRVLRRRGALSITETKHGFICANAGIDWSNIESGKAVLLPIDPDRSARKIRDGIRGSQGVEIGVVISDTWGRAWRSGAVNFAIGCAGIVPVLDLRGTADGNGEALRTTEICVADEIAAAAELVMGKAKRIPFVIARGLDSEIFGDGSITRDVVRKPNDDLFR